MTPKHTFLKKGGKKNKAEIKNLNAYSGCIMVVGQWLIFFLLFYNEIFIPALCGCACPSGESSSFGVKQPGGWGGGRGSNPGLATS